MNCTSRYAVKSHHSNYEPTPDIVSRGGGGARGRRGLVDRGPSQTGQHCSDIAATNSSISCDGRDITAVHQLLKCTQVPLWSVFCNVFDQETLLGVSVALAFQMHSAQLKVHLCFLAIAAVQWYCSEAKQSNTRSKANYRARYVCRCEAWRYKGA